MSRSPRAGLVGLFVVTAAACGSGDNSGGTAGRDASADTAALPEASADVTVPVDSGPASDASDAGITFGAPLCTPRGGTRIKVRWYQGPEGARIFDSMYDSMLDVPCAAVTTADGKLRCVPLTGDSGPVFYTDMTCKTPVMAKSDYSCTVPAYAATYAGDGCTADASLYRVGAQQGADAGTLYQMYGTTCSPALYQPQTDYYALTPVPDSTFVEATPGKLTVGPYAMNTIEYSDGARDCIVDDGFFDSTSNIWTFPQTLRDNAYHLAPSASPSTGFSNSQCTTPATLQVAGCFGPPPPYAVDLDQCTFVSAVRSVGAPIDGGFQLDYAPDASFVCDPAGPAPEGGTWNAVSAPLAPSLFPPVLTQGTGTGRLQTLTWATVGGLRWLWDQAYDTQTNAMCFVAADHAATAQCIPSTAFGAGVMYTEMTCTQPLYLVSMPTSCVPAGFPGANAVAELGTCPPRVVHIGAPYTGVMFQKNGRQLQRGRLSRRLLLARRRRHRRGDLRADDRGRRVRL